MKLETAGRKHSQYSTWNRHIGMDFLNKASFAQKLMPTLDTQDFIKPNSFCTAKETIKWGGRPQKGNESDRGLVARIYKELKI